MLHLFKEIVQIVLPVFLVIGLGYGVRRLKVVDNTFLFQLNRLIYYLALPLLLFYKIATADFDESFTFQLVIGLAVLILLMFVISYGFAVMANYSQSIRGTFCQCSFRGNLAYIGLAIVFNAYGERGLATAGIILGCIVPVLNLFSIIALLLPQQGNRIKPLFFLQQIVLNPLIIASFLGITWSFFHLSVPTVLDKALHIVTGMALPLALISIGASFSVEKLKGDVVQASLATLLKLVLMPVVGWVIFVFLGVSGTNLAIGILLAGTPTATAAYIMTQQIGGDAELSGTIIMLTTLLSMFSYTVILLFLKTGAI